jgi:hypothetical protein
MGLSMAASLAEAHVRNDRRKGVRARVARLLLLLLSLTLGRILMRAFSLRTNLGFWALAAAASAAGCGASAAMDRPSVDAGCGEGACEVAANVAIATAPMPAPEPSEARALTDGAPSSACVPQAGPDVPDDAFTDSNCDGIDGDASHAVFVAASLGSDEGDGSMAHPVQTFAAAIALAMASGKDVYACNGTYTESIELTASAVNLYGGYDCANGWQRIDDTFVLAPPAGVPLAVRTVAKAMIVDHAKLRAADATAPGTSSVASLIASAQVTFHRVIFQTGAGADGSAGPTATAGTSAALGGADGQSWSDVSCTLPCTVTAQGGGIRSCGVGGAAGSGGSGQNGNATQAWAASSGGPTGLGGAVTAQDGLPGSIGPTGSDGAASTSGFGSVTSTGYEATNAGIQGAAGGPGGGGAGGAGGRWTERFGGGDTPCVPSFEVGGGGGAGGCGGAGGAAGGGGGGGGASIGLISIDSTATLTACTVSTGSGGSGGAPSAGAPGQPGGPGGEGGAGAVQGSGSCVGSDDRIYGADGYAGGAGGAGGKGGAGGPGGGGPSIGIVSSGPVASADPATVFNVGAGGQGAASTDGTGDGPDGLSASTLNLGGSDAGADAATSP